MNPTQELHWIWHLIDLPYEQTSPETVAPAGSNQTCWLNEPVRASQEKTVALRT